MKPIDIVIADDDPGMLLVMRKLVEKAGGYQLAGEASDGEALLRLYDEARPEVVLMDVEMPGMTGMDAAREIRSFDAVKRTALHYGALGVCISGAGPTILAITQKNNLSAFSEHMRDYLSSKEPNWQYYDLSPDNEGTTIDFNVEVDL